MHGEGVSRRDGNGIEDIPGYEEIQQSLDCGLETAGAGAAPDGHLTSFSVVYDDITKEGPETLN